MSISASFQQQMGMRLLVEFLGQHGLPMELAAPLYRSYGGAALEALKNDPYLLVGEGFGVEFSLADRLALSLGLAGDDPLRLEAGLTFELALNLNNGHVFLPRGKLLAAAGQLLDIPVEELKDALERLSLKKQVVQDAVAVIPHGANVKLESAGQTQGALHEDFLARQDRAISKILMGQTLTVEMEGANSLAAAETHRSVAEDLADADKAMVVDAWNEIAWLYAQVNAGPGVLAPLAAYDEPEDLNTRADLDKKLVEIGVRFTAEHFKENYGLKESEFTVDAPQPEGIANFTAPSGRKPLAEKAQATLDTAIAKMLPGALKASAEFVTRVENAVRKAASYDDMQDALVELLAPSMTPDALESFLARAMTAAAGYGATAVAAEEAEDGNA